MIPDIEIFMHDIVVHVVQGDISLRDVPKEWKSECLDSVVIHCHGNNISSAPFKLGRCCVADESSQFGGGERELRNIIIFKTNKRTDITVMTTRHYVPGGERATE